MRYMLLSFLLLLSSGSFGAVRDLDRTWETLSIHKLMYLGATIEELDAHLKKFPQSLVSTQTKEGGNYAFGQALDAAEPKYIQWLLDRGCDPNAVCGRGPASLPVLYAIRRPMSNKAAELLLSHPKVVRDYRAASYLNPFCVAVERDHLERVNWCIADGAFKGLMQDQQSVLVTTIMRYASLSVLDACLKAEPRLKLLFHSNHKGLGVIHYNENFAAAKKIVSMLDFKKVEYGKYGNSVLCNCVYNREEQLIPALLAQGANPFADERVGGSAFKIAVERGNKNLVNLFMKSPFAATYAKPLPQEKDVGPELVLAVLAGEKDPKARGFGMYTALHFAAEAGSREWCEKLIAKGVDKNAQTSSRHSAVMVAQLHGHEDLAEWLREQGIHGGMAGMEWVERYIKEKSLSGKGLWRYILRKKKLGALQGTWPQKLLSKVVEQAVREQAWSEMEWLGTIISQSLSEKERLGMLYSLVRDYRSDPTALRNCLKIITVPQSEFVQMIVGTVATSRVSNLRLKNGDVVYASRQTPKQERILESFKLVVNYFIKEMKGRRQYLSRTFELGVKQSDVEICRYLYDLGVVTRSELIQAKAKAKATKGKKSSYRPSHAKNLISVFQLHEEKASPAMQAWLAEVTAEPEVDSDGENAK